MRRVAPDGAIDPRLPFSCHWPPRCPTRCCRCSPFEVAFRLCQLLSAALMVIALLLLQRGAPTLPSPARGGRKYIVLAMIGLLAAVPTWGAFTEGQPTAWLLLGAAMAIVALPCRFARASRRRRHVARRQTAVPPRLPHHPVRGPTLAIAGGAAAGGAVVTAESARGRPGGPDRDAAQRAQRQPGGRHPPQTSPGSG